MFVRLMPVILGTLLPYVPIELKFTVISLAFGAMMPIPSFACILFESTQAAVAPAPPIF